MLCLLCSLRVLLLNLSSFRVFSVFRGLISPSFLTIFPGSNFPPRAPTVRLRAFALGPLWFQPVYPVQ